MDPKWRLEASSKSQVEPKWHLEATLKGQVESKLRLEASLKHQVESKLCLEAVLKGQVGYQLRLDTLLGLLNALPGLLNAIFSRTTGCTVRADLARGAQDDPRGSTLGCKDAQEASKSHKTPVKVQFDSKQRHLAKTVVFLQENQGFRRSGALQNASLEGQVEPKWRL